MGGSYGHVLAIGCSRDEVAEVVGNDPTYLATFDDVIAIFSQAAVEDTMSRCIELSAQLDGDCVGFFVFDDDVLACVHCRSGDALAEVTVPTMAEYAGIDEDELALMAEMFDEDQPTAGSTDDPVAFVTGLGRGDQQRAIAVLGTDFGGGDHVSATARHRELLEALELPTSVAGWDYYAIEADGQGFEGEASLVRGT